VEPRASTPFEALSDPTRRTILERLREGPCSVKDIAERLPVSRPAVSQHLRVLERAGLVSARRDGTSRIYRLEAGWVGGVRAYLDSFWSAALAQFAEAAETDERRVIT
jgi:DNA-binding transcriptional ArsR family regulator